ncbi:uncharacterized protein LOC134474518 isoform X1 [Cavia porcellus]|uniref:uncharacterized protein LOC134474518 isoform X1 n=1 Tax=Cavia porcellus TaxID=10141 RepID=UPI002FE0856D
MGGHLGTVTSTRPWAASSRPAKLPGSSCCDLIGLVLVRSDNTRRSHGQARERVTPPWPAGPSRRPASLTMPSPGPRHLAQWHKHLPGKCKVVSLIPGTKKEKTQCHRQGGCHRGAAHLVSDVMCTVRPQQRCPVLSCFLVPPGPAAHRETPEGIPASPCAALAPKRLVFVSVCRHRERPRLDWTKGPPCKMQPRDSARAPTLLGNSSSKPSILVPEPMHKALRRPGHPGPWTVLSSARVTAEWRQAPRGGAPRPRERPGRGSQLHPHLVLSVRVPVSLSTVVLHAAIVLSCRCELQSLEGVIASASSADRAETSRLLQKIKYF